MYYRVVVLQLKLNRMITSSTILFHENIKIEKSIYYLLIIF